MEKQKSALAIHDISCIGRCSLTVALPILSAAGIYTGVLPTAVLSTHTGGFEGFTYRDLTEDIQPISKHWQSLGIQFDALYSGFLGSFEQIDLVAALFDAFKTPDNFILVDPVMADNGKLYSIYSPQMAKGMAKLCTKADIVVPNLTEAAFLLDEPYVGDTYTREHVETLLRKLTDLGGRMAVLTGISYREGHLGAAGYDKETNQFYYADNTWIDGYFHGTGDVFGSGLLAAMLNQFSLEESLQFAVDYTHKCIELTVENGAELRFGPCFERATSFLVERLHLGQ